MGELNDNNKDTILAAVKAKNPNLDINDVGISKITNISADINGLSILHKDSYNSNKYIGWKRFDFTVKPDITVTQNSLTNNTYYMNIKNNEFKATPLQNSKIRNTVLAIATTSSGDSYFATFDGVYYTKNSESILNSTKIDGIDEPITEITVSNSGSVYFTGVSGNDYYWPFFVTAEDPVIRIDTYYNLPEIKNVISIITDSENDVYFNTDHGVFALAANTWNIVKKIDGIDEPISKMTIDKNDNVYFESFFSSSYTNKYKEKFNSVINIQQDNPNIIIDTEDKKIIEGVELLHNLQSNGDYGLVPVNRINRGYLNFVNSFSSVMQYLNNNNIVTNANNANLSRLTRGIPYRLNNQNRFFILNVDIISSNPVNRRLQLVFNSFNLYLQGFIIRNGETYTSPGTYYHFDDAVYTNLGDRNLESRTIRVRSQTNSGWLNLGGSYLASYSDQDNPKRKFQGLDTQNTNPDISWDNIIDSFRGLLNYDERITRAQDIRKYLIQVIFSTSESWRFNNLYTQIARVSINEGTSQDRRDSFPWVNFADQLRSWNTQGDFDGPLDDTTIFDRNNNYIDLRFILLLGFFSNIRIANSR